MIIAAVSFLALAGMAGLIYRSYNEVVHLVKEQFINQQMLTTRQTARGISQNIDLVVRELQLLSENPSLRNINSPESLAIMQQTFEYVKSLHVNDISQLDSQGMVRSSLYSRNLIGQDFSFREYFVTLKKSAGRDPAYQFITFRGVKKGQKGIIIAMSVLDDRGQFAGVVLFAVEVNNLLQGFITEAAEGSKTWVIDGEGIVMFHPDFSPGTILEQLPGIDKSFRSFLGKTQGLEDFSGEYVSPSGKLIIGTAHPVTVAGKTWWIVMETPEVGIKGLLIRFNTQYFLGISLAFITIIGGFFIIIRLVNKWNLELEAEITERKKAEGLIRESEMRFRQLIEYSPVAMAVIDGDENIVYLNTKFRETFGYTLEDIPHVKDWLLRAYPENRYRETMAAKWNNFLRRDTRSGREMRPSEYHVTCNDGSVLVMEMFGTEIGGKYFILMSDITERRRLEQQLLHSQKMESIGQLAGGVAHDFNNILSAIMGYGELLQHRIGSDDPASAYVDVILNSARSASKLVHSLLAFSRKQALLPQPIMLYDLVQKVEKLLGRIIGEDIRLEIGFANKEIAVFADYGQLEQVLMNLATNSRDAMPGGGTINIRTDVVKLDKDYVSSRGFGTPGTYALLSFADSGSGMDEKTAEKIFEPFFTTKEIGHGTGLGLSIVYGIIKQHGGYIDVQSSPGEGTEFRIYLPLRRTQAGTPEERTADQDSIPLAGGNEKILVAEDNEQVRILTREILENAGYEVIVAVDGDDAVKKFMEHKGSVQLLLLDVIMPEKNGKKVYDEIIKMDSSVKCIFMSGYTANILDRKGITVKGRGYIRKPVSSTDLLNKVREVLDE